jgi:phosphatidyl-myo-inositol dimannoside synthase
VNRPGKLRCLALVTDAFGGRGGIAQYNRDFLTALASPPLAAGVEVLPRHAPDVPELPPGVVQAAARRGRLRYSAAAVLAACRGRPGIVFCGHLHMAPLAAAVARLAGARLIVQTHGVEVWPVPPWPRRVAVEAADLVLCVSRHTRAAVLQWADIAPERAIVIPDTIGEPFAPGDGAALRSAWGLAGKKVLLTVGRLDPRERYKGQDRVMRAIPVLAARGHDILYVVVGEGGDRGRLERLAHALGLAERVRFTGALPREQLVEVYRMADLYVMPSTGEGFGIAFLEAMASGTPTLGLAIAGARDALADGELGTVIGETELTATLDDLLAAPPAGRRQIADRVRARFGRAVFRERVALALDRLCAAATGA